MDLLRRYPREKIFRATLVQHGHSAGEQCLFQALWSAATPEQGRESRILRMGYRGLAALSNLNPKSVKANLRSLEEKLAIETIGEFNSIESSGRTYRIFSYNQILARRKAAGMIWVRKMKGVEFINPESISTPGIQTPPVVVSTWTPYVAPTGAESTTGAGGTSSPGPGVETPSLISTRGSTSFRQSSSASPAIVQALRQYVPDVDDDAARRLADACRFRTADASEAEIVHFIHLKAGVPGIKAPMGFLLTAVPKCFEGESLRQFRQEERRRREEQEHARRAAEAEMRAFREQQQRILMDPSSAEEDRRFARRMLGLEE